MKKIAVTACALALTCSVLVGCASAPAEPKADEPAAPAATEAPEVTPGTEMAYKAPADVEADLSSADQLVLDVRKAADYETGHIEGAISADMDAAKDGDYASGIANLEAALADVDTEGKTLVLVCYSGARYAQAATDCLNALGYDMSKVVTMEGGMKAWTGATVA